MRVLITGGTSVIGLAVAERLLARGDEVTTLARHPGPAGRSITEVLGDITDDQVLAQAVEGCQAVIHLAAKVDVVGARHEFERVNVEGTRRLLLAAQAAGISRFVHVSSPSVAHDGGSLIGAGAGPADPNSTRGHYSTTKALAEQLALQHRPGGPAVVAIRPHLVWGPGDQQLTERIVDRARSGRLAVIGSGGALIDTTYLDNAADALVAALDRAEEVAGRAFVVSNGEPRPIAELLTRIAAAGGQPPPRLRVPRRVAFAAGIAIERLWEAQDRTDDPPMTSFLAEQLATAHWFEQSSTREALEWEPVVSLDEGFRRLTAWYEQHATTARWTQGPSSCFAALPARLFRFAWPAIRISSANSTSAK